jgi:rhodanese-related sulfurtransferase
MCAVLTVPVLALIILFTVPGSAGAEAVQKLLSPDAALHMSQTGAVTIIDIRRPDEWRTTGIVPGAKKATIDFGRGTGRFLNRIKRLTNGDKSTPIALICAAGVRSKHAAALLRRHGYTAVADISEGMTGGVHGAGWIKRGLPIASCRAC